MRLYVFGAIAVGAAAIGIYDQYDKNTNYLPVEARISDVNEQCYMEKVEHGAVMKTTYTSDLVRCEVAELLTREHPKWRGYAIKHKIVVQFDYVSPVDGATHASSLTMSDFPNGQPLSAGDVLRVLASKTKAEKIRKL
jgi:hypothetical protein